MSPYRYGPAIHTGGKENQLNIPDENGFIYSKPMGMNNEPRITEGILISGLPCPPLLSANCEQNG